LGISRYKDFDQVCRAGQQASDEVGIAYDMTNWRKDGGEELRRAVETEFNMYRQRYCGCKPR
jgi:predicted adenine nucleotide alpha hydrolase (AANH) superfamily ATPase